MRLIDANKVEIGFDELCQSPYFKNDVNTKHGAETLMDLCVRSDSHKPNTIDPETLPIVQELRKELEQVTRERDEIATLCGKLIMICDQPRDEWKELFLKYRGSMIGDYMGSGYPFVDAFNRIVDDFMLTMSDGAYKAVMEATHKEIQSKRKPSEAQED